MQGHGPRHNLNGRVKAVQLIKQTSLDEELLKQWALQVRRSPIPVIPSMGLIAYMASQYVSAWYWGSWFILVVAMQGLRWAVFRSLPEETHIPEHKRMRTAIRINLAGTLLHSVSLAWFPLFSPFQAAVQSMLFMGMGVGSVMMSAGYPPWARQQAYFSLAPLFAMWIWSGAFGAGGITALFLGIIGVGYTALILQIAKNAFELYNESFDNRAQLEVALERAEAAGRAKTRFLASASHDLRQPMHALSLFSAALATRQLEDETTEIVDNINASVEALSYELDGLLDISKLDAGIVEVNRTHVRLSGLLRRLLDEFSTPASNRGIRTRLECPEDAIADTDGALLERIFRNLVSNAINHNTNCDLVMRVTGKGDSWHIVVEDNGRGIDPAKHGRIFEEFYQLENPERDRSKGLGLGLSIVRRLSELLDARMTFESSAGLGTRLGFTIDAVNEKSPVPAPQDPGENVRDLLTGLAVLVVDDEISVRSGMSTLLGNLGCRVLLADGTESAVEVASKSEPDIVLADFRLRDDDTGLAAIERLRVIYPGIPAIVISGDTAPDRLQEISRSGIPVLVKPVLIGPLQEAIVQGCFPAARSR